MLSSARSFFVEDENILDEQKNLKKKIVEEKLI